MIAAAWTIGAVGVSVGVATTFYQIRKTAEASGEPMRELAKAVKSSGDLVNNITIGIVASTLCYVAIPYIKK